MCLDMGGIALHHSIGERLYLQHERRKGKVSVIELRRTKIMPFRVHGYTEEAGHRIFRQDKGSGNGTVRVGGFFCGGNIIPVRVQNLNLYRHTFLENGLCIIGKIGV